MKGASLTFVCTLPMPARASPKAQKGFDYTGLDIETSQFVQQQTGEIRTLMKRTAQGIVEIGCRLIDVKECLGHGKFGAWLLAEFEWTDRTARQFMRVAEEFKSANFADLPFAPSALYLLSAPSTPKAAKEEALARAESGEPITYTTAKAIKQKYAIPSATPKSKPELEPVLQPQPTPTAAALPQSGAKLEIVALHRQIQPDALSEPTPPSTTAPQILLPSQLVHAPEKPGSWWQLGGRHLMYCGDLNSSEFLARVKEEKVSLLFAFPPSPDWQPTIRTRTHLITMEYLPQGKELRLFEDALEANLLLYSDIGDVVVSCFLPSPEILSIVNRLDRRALFAERDSMRVKAIISDWKKAGLKAERLS